MCRGLARPRRRHRDRSRIFAAAGRLLLLGGGLFSSQIARADIISALEAHYACSNLSDSSGNGRNLSAVTGAVTFVGDLRLSNACRFDGATKIKSVNNAFSQSNSASYAFWIRTPDPSGQTLIMQTVPNASTNNTYNSIDMTPPSLLRVWGNNGGFPFSFKGTGSLTVFDNSWHSVVITTNHFTSLVTIYIDRAAVSSTLSGADAATDLQTTLYIGTRSDANSNYFAGDLGDIRIFSRELTAQDAAEYHAAHPPGSSQPIPTLSEWGMIAMFLALALAIQLQQSRAAG